MINLPNKPNHPNLQLQQPKSCAAIARHKEGIVFATYYAHYAPSETQATEEGNIKHTFLSLF